MGKTFDYCQRAVKRIFLYFFGVSKNPTREAILSNTIQALRDKRIRKNLSMNKLAALCGLHVSMISLMERELRSPTLDVLLRISEALEIDLWTILKEATKNAKSASDNR